MFHLEGRRLGIELMRNVFIVGVVQHSSISNSHENSSIKLLTLTSNALQHNEHSPKNIKEPRNDDANPAEVCICFAKIQLLSSY